MGWIRLRQEKSDDVMRSLRVAARHSRWVSPPLCETGCTINNEWIMITKLCPFVNSYFWIELEKCGEYRGKMVSCRLYVDPSDFDAGALLDGVETAVGEMIDAVGFGDHRRVVRDDQDCA